MSKRKTPICRFELSMECMRDFIHKHGIKQNDIFFIKKSKNSELVWIAFLADENNEGFGELGIHPKALEKAQAIADKYKMVDKKGEQM